MSAPLYFSRARLRHDAPVSALRALLVPTGESARIAAGHRLVWTLFGDTPDRTRDFLWREAKPGVFYFLSRRIPEDRHGLFELDAPKPFEPALCEGDRLAFVLRANATVARGGGPGRRGKPCDIVMDALRGTSPGERARVRRRAVETAGLAWLAGQGARAGFTFDWVKSCEGVVCATSEDVDCEAPAEENACSSVRVLGYRTLRFERPGAPVQLGVLDFEGVLLVRDPACFLDALARGFGRAKAFGCGLMLIQRA